MAQDTWRDSEGFSRELDAGYNTWYCIGPDDEEHAIGCMFFIHKGILPCSCDRTRREGTDWYKGWMRWQKARSANILRHQWPLPWPITGPAGDPWIETVDFG